MRKHTHATALLAFFLCATMAACDGAASLETYVSSATQMYCVRMVQCDRIGEKATYATFFECQLSVAPFFASLWPAAQCGQPSTEGDYNEALIDPNGYHQCELWLQAFPCDAELFQATTVPDTCKADTLCNTTTSSVSQQPADLVQPR